MKNVKIVSFNKVNFEYYARIYKTYYQKLDRKLVYFCCFHLKKAKQTYAITFSNFQVFLKTFFFHRPDILDLTCLLVWQSGEGNLDVILCHPSLYFLHFQESSCLHTLHCPSPSHNVFESPIPSNTFLYLNLYLFISLLTQFSLYKNQCAVQIT